ncbi:MAG: transglutaminase family protein, partial [Nitrospinaceae bacterium]
KKTELARDLFLRLSAKFGRGGLLHFGQGKWYPGEQLPRWSMACFWRKDGAPIWKQEDWLATRKEDRGHTMDTAKQFIGHLAVKLLLPEACVIPAYEDAIYYLWKEQKLPVEGDIFKADLHEKTERRRLQKLLEGNLNHPAGYVLPLAFAEPRDQWISNRWVFRSKRLILTIGDSPIGFRLPLDSLPSVPQEQIHEALGHEPSVFQALGQFPAWEEFGRILEGRKRGVVSASGKATPEDPGALVRTALCVEPRGGQLHVFIPPVKHAAHYLELISAVESVAGHMKVPVTIEGYEPPHEPGLQHFRITPDPGVIEVNVHPAHSWDELNEIIGTVYEEAYQSRLVADKFMIDGRRVGTGGGNHIIAGGATPQDSPFLRRPDLLRSFITFWQNHPSLSYLFSAMFIGPTSQFPRVDEARMDSLYDLDIAFKEMSR